MVFDPMILVFLSVELEFVDRFKVNTAKKRITALDVAI